MYVRVHAAGQDKLTRCVQLLPAFKCASNLHDNAVGDTNVGAANRASSSHDLAVADRDVEFSHVTLLVLGTSAL